MCANKGTSRVVYFRCNAWMDEWLVEYGEMVYILAALHCTEIRITLTYTYFISWKIEIGGSSSTSCDDNNDSNNIYS